MLTTVKSSIRNTPDISFAEYYQQYIKSVQDTLLDKITKDVPRNFDSIDDLPIIINGINALTEELKKT